VHTQVDPTIDFVWKHATPVTGERADAFSVCWEGFLVPPVSGMYRLGVNGFNAYQLELDGDLIVEYRGVHHPIARTKQVPLEAGRYYHICLRMASYGADPQVKLLWSVPGMDEEAQALEAARKADVVVMALGLSPVLEGEEMPVKVEGFVGGDRTDIALPRPQRELLKQIHALGKPMVLVLLNGSAVAVNWAESHVPAILEAWYPGQAGGDAIADVLFGDYCPGGRLPVTFYRSVDDLPPFADYDMEGHTYRYFRGEPLYPFGFGLSYTRFRYQDLEVTPNTTNANDPVQVSVTVHNVGDCAGDEVVQLYLSDLEASVPVPIRQLVGFERVHLAPAQVKTISFAIQPEQLSVIADDGRRLVEAGDFQIAVGGMQPGFDHMLDGTTEVLTRILRVTSQLE
jgi:beta-glucosidase